MRRSIKLRIKVIMFFWFKEDLHNAFDSALWDYLNDVMVRIGFGILWRSLIKECLSSSKMVIFCMFLHWFALIFGLRVNYFKSSMTKINLDDDYVSGMTSSFFFFLQ